MAFVEKHVHTREIAEDIVQNAFLRALERGGALEKEESVVAWFYRMLRNAVIDHYRKHASNERALESWAAEFERNTVLPEPLKNEVCHCVGALFAGLKPEYRDALEQVDLEEGSLRDLAERAGISENNAAVRIHRARRALLNGSGTPATPVRSMDVLTGDCK